MDGFLDEMDQAFLTIDLGNGPLDFQVDTGCSAAFVIGEELFDLPSAIPVARTEALLAGGHSQMFQAFEHVIDWLGEETLVPILVGPGTDLLVGTALLNPHRLEIDYGQRTVRLDRNPDW